MMSDKRIRNCYVPLKRENFSRYYTNEELVAQMKPCKVVLNNFYSYLPIENDKDFDNLSTKCVKYLDDNNNNQNEDQSNHKRIDIFLHINPGNVLYGTYVNETNFIVDYFKQNEYVEHYFLTRFNDKMERFGKDFKQNLYLSQISAMLLVKYFDFDEQFLRIIHPDTPIIIQNVEVTAITVPNYAGAFMYVFKLQSGKCILHAGNCRVTAEMEEFPIFWNNKIDTIYFDPISKVEINFDYTLNYDLDLPLIEHCSKFAEENKMNGTKGLIVFGTHHIGQEYLWLRIAMHLKESVWVNDEQRKLLTILADERVLNVLENDPAAAGIHIIQAYEIQEDHLLEYLNRFRFAYRLLAVRCFGNQIDLNIFYNKYPLRIVDVPNPLISTRKELNRFILFLLCDNSLQNRLLCNELANFS